MTPSPRTPPRLWAGAVLAVVLLQAVLRFPGRPRDMGIGTFLLLPIELPIILLALLILRAWWLRAAVVTGATGVLILRIADIGTFQAFSRPFNPALDLHLLVSGWDLLSSSIGRAQALALIAAAVLAVGAVAAALWWALSALVRLRGVARRAAVAVSALLLVAGLAGLAVPRAPVTADLIPETARRLGRMTDAVRDLRAFAAELPQDDVGQPGFAALRGRDVIVVFVESYGRSFVEDAPFAPAAQDRLRAVEARLAEAGWHARSGWLTAASRGGQSWLNHGTFLSGLWVDGQARYDRLMTSERRSLNRLFGQAGWRTGAVMPAITLDWPEAAWFGYDVTLDAAGLGYRGQPFEWVTMPDQYTLTALDDRLRGTGPVMVEAALITSHAPWTPLPRILPWEEIGDGSVFDGSNRDGDTPREVWADPDRIRTQYALALDYSLEVIGQWVARQPEDALIVVLGDHQPAQLLTGPDATADVPIHVMSRDAALLDRLPDDIFGPGMIPSPDRPAQRMDAMRAVFATEFEDAG
ncbi:sulfatase [Jannaschia rubra]|uniref:sulfatase n=1 Tax=Jannaschia rubra TaxID=282197 RepID=UPI00249099B8|nr:sulfatase [Jannaschia rubra]